MDVLNSLPQLPSLYAYAILIWSLFWKGLALWKSAKQNQRYWFIAMLVLNTVGILEIIYLFKFAKEKMTLNDLKNLKFS